MVSVCVVWSVDKSSGGARAHTDAAIADHNALDVLEGGLHWSHAFVCVAVESVADCAFALLARVLYSNQGQLHLAS